MTRLVIMGVSGCGKSTVGEALALATGIDYLDGDALHSSASIERMTRGIPLTDDDRWPWLDAVADSLNAKPEIAVGCSALRRAYRDRIRHRSGQSVTFFHLLGSREDVVQRMAHRSGHFMPTSLVDSQFDALEELGPGEGHSIPITLSVAQIVDRIVEIIRGTK